MNDVHSNDVHGESGNYLDDVNDNHSNDIDDSVGGSSYKFT